MTADAETHRVIHIAAAVILDDSGRMLVVRKRDTEAFMQPGGKIDAGETPIEALERELREEIALDLDADAFEYAGVFSARAANEPDTMVTAHTYIARHSGEVRPAAEIADARWLPLDGAPALHLAELTREHMLPLARATALNHP